MRILILDDEQEVIDSLKGLLGGLHDLTGTTDAEAAVEMTKAQTFDFVLVDYCMPNRDGKWFMENVRLPRSTKVLLMTGFLDHDLLRQMFRLGISGYLIKPFNKDEILRHLELHSRSPD